MSTATNALALAAGAGAGFAAWYVLRGRGEAAPSAPAPAASGAAPVAPISPPPPAGPPCAIRVDAKAITANGHPVTIPIAVAICKNQAGGADLTYTQDASGAVLFELTTALGRAGVKVVAQHRNAAGKRRPNSTKADVNIELPHFAETVLGIARGVDENPTSDGKARGRFGRKVFIAAIRRGLKETGYWRLSRPTINELLVDANREGLLQLTRADLVSAMDPTEVRASEIKSLNSLFHFVIADRDSRNAATYRRFTLRSYPQGHKGNATARWFVADPATTRHDARDRLIAAGVVAAEVGGRTHEPGGWMLSVDTSWFNTARAEPLP